MTKSTDIQAAVALLESSGQYRLIKALEPLKLHRDASRPVNCVIVDCEATSKDPATASAIEAGMLKVGFDPADPTSIVAIDSLSMLNDPGVPSEPGAEAVHGIKAEELIGQHFDQDAIAKFMEGVDFVLAHNAGYDRPVLSRSIPLLKQFPWACSLKEVDWASMGIGSRTLEHLLYKTGQFHEAHRALADCEALLAVVAHPYLDGLPPLLAINESRQDESWIILCTGAPFDAKDDLKARGCRWNPGDAAGDIPVKCWSTAEITGQQNLLTELEWLLTEVYKRPDASVTAIPMNATLRYAEQSRLTAFQKKSEFRLGAAIAKLRGDLFPSPEPQVQRG